MSSAVFCETCTGVGVWMCMHVRADVCMCVHVYMRACVRACACMCIGMWGGGGEYSS